MEILQDYMDSTIKMAKTIEFLRDFCPEDRKAEVESLMAQEAWEQIDAIMIPFHNVPNE
jgi:hypothetical protein